MKQIFSIYGNDGPVVIAGPCSAESREQVLATASELSRAGVKIFRAGVWKPRTRPGGFEGHGAVALEWLREVKARYGMLTATEVGTPEHAATAVDGGVDVVWLGARTTASPFAVQAIADALAGADVPVLVKNPVCADVDLWLGALERLRGRGIGRLGAIHRGFRIPGETTYRNAPLWDVADDFRRQMPDVPILCDPSHIGGRRDVLLELWRTAQNRNYDGLIVEVHCDPAHAWTDASQQITPEELREWFGSAGIGPTEP